MFNGWVWNLPSWGSCVTLPMAQDNVNHSSNNNVPSVCSGKHFHYDCLDLCKVGVLYVA